jgi:hypothetical protein
VLQSKAGRPLELDIYISDLSLAFEYQGRQHFENVHLLSEHKHHEMRDIEKREACKRVNKHCILNSIVKSFFSTPRLASL